MKPLLKKFLLLLPVYVRREEVIPMHLRAIFAIARKDALDLILNRVTRVLLLTPIFASLLFVFISNLAGTTTTDLLIYNPGNSGLEQVITASFTGAHVVHANSADDVSGAFGSDGSKKKTHYTLGIDIPSDFDTALHSNQQPGIQVYLNGDYVSNAERDMVEATIANYARHVVAPQDPLTMAVATINPPQPNNIINTLNKFYALLAAMVALMTGLSIVPSLMVEEKEKKTLRMLLISPASMTDIIVSKMLVGFGYELALLLVALAITNGFIGQLPLTMLFSFLGIILSLAIGVLAGAFFQTMSATNAFGSIASLIFMVPSFILIVGSGSNNPLVPIIKLLPVYYIADGLYNALNATTNAGTFALDVGVIAGSIIILVVAAVLILRRQTLIQAAV
jgi:ABC-2 type transport system permease protein